MYIVPASLTKPRVNDEVVHVRVGDRLTLQCEATGTPTPTVLLLKDIIDFTRRSQDYGEGTALRRERTFEPVQKEDEGLYVCLASNILVGPPGGKRKVTDWKTIQVQVTGMFMHNNIETLHTIGQISVLLIIIIELQLKIARVYVHLLFRE